MRSPGTLHRSKRVMVKNNQSLLGIDERLCVILSWNDIENDLHSMSTMFTFWMVCTPEHVVHHVQVFRDAGGIKRNRRREFLIRLFRQILDLILDAIFSHPVDEVDVTKMPADGFWVLWRSLEHLLHHGRPAGVLLGHNHLVDVQHGDVLEPRWESFINIRKWKWKSNLYMFL